MLVLNVQPMKAAFSWQAPWLPVLSTGVSWDAGDEAKGYRRDSYWAMVRT